jgi:hypothetical protein
MNNLLLAGVTPQRSFFCGDVDASRWRNAWGLVGAVSDGGMTVITVRHHSGAAPCPGCGAHSGRVHTRYLRRLSNLPLAGRPVRLVLVARRFRCNAALCGPRIFTGRFGDGVLAPWARWTCRLDYVVHPARPEASLRGA